MSRRRNYKLGTLTIGDTTSTIWISVDSAGTTFKSEKTNGTRKPWTKDEDEEIARLMGRGIPPAKISPILNRTPQAISSRASQLRKEGKKIPSMKK